MNEHSDHSGLQHGDPHRGRRSMKHRRHHRGSELTLSLWTQQSLWPMTRQRGAQSVFTTVNTATSSLSYLSPNRLSNLQLWMEDCGIQEVKETVTIKWPTPGWMRSPCGSVWAGNTDTASASTFVKQHNRESQILFGLSSKLRRFAAQYISYCSEQEGSRCKSDIIE